MKTYFSTFTSTLKIPTTVEGMGLELKKVCDDYSKGQIESIKEFQEVINYLKELREDLFSAAVTDRWVGKKRKMLIESALKVK